MDTNDTITMNGSAARAASVAGILGAERPEAAAAEKRATYDGRFYGPILRDGEPRYYPSVTTILNDVKVGYGFEQWGKEQAAMLGVEGARLDMILRAEDGSLVHDALNRLVWGETLDWKDFPGKRNDDLPWKTINRFRQWCELARPEYLATELTVYSHTHEFAGTCDAIVRIGGKILVVDYKTSKQVNRSHQIQVAAYAHAVTEMYPELAQHSCDGEIGGAVLALNTRHKAGYDFAVVKELDVAWSHFLNRLRCFRDEHPTLDPKHDLLPETISLTVAINPLLVGGAV